MTAFEEILQAPNLRKLIDELEAAWVEEQKRRHEFWAEIDENVKAEFIMGEIVYHSPIYGRHWKASTRLSRKLIPYVYDNQLGEVAYEKVMVRLTRNDYERYAAAARYLLLAQRASLGFWSKTICLSSARFYCRDSL